MSAAREAFERLGGDLFTSYAEFCPPQLVHLAVEIEKYVPVLDVVDAAIARGANLDLIWPRWALWLFEIELQKYETSAPLAALFRRVLAGDLPSEEEWATASVAASSATRSRTRSRSPAVVRAARVASWSAKSGLASMEAWAALASVHAASVHAAPETETETWTRMAEHLKHLLQEAKP